MAVASLKMRGSIRSKGLTMTPWIVKLLPSDVARHPVYLALFRNIVLTILIVSIVPMVVVSSTLYLQFRQSYREKVNDHLRELVQKHQQNIDTFLRERLTDIKLMAARNGFERLRDESFLQRNLELLSQEYGHIFVDLGVVNASGDQEAYAGPFKLANAHYRDSNWFREAMQRDHFISDVFLGLRGLPHFIVAVHGTDQGKSWILRATIDFESFNTLVENIRIGSTGGAFILNREGKLQTSASAAPDIAHVNRLWDAVEGNREGVQVFLQPDGSGREAIYATAFLNGGEWLLVYRQNAEDAFADLDRSFFLTTLIMMLGTSSIFVMAFALSLRMVKRLSAIDFEKKLMNEKLIETGKLASIGELAAGVAHEINNPVAIMIEEAGWIGDLLEEEDLRETAHVQEFKRSLSQIRTQGKRCKEITYKLLSFARKTSAQVQDIEINELVDSLLVVSAQRAKYNEVEITTDFADGLPVVRHSVSELQQVFLNLINNALDAMENRGGKLSVSTRREGEFAVLTISDTGAGIPAPLLKRIFDPFFTTKAVGKGTGLGLSICFGIVDKMGGRIEVTSAVDVGSTFKVYLPVTVKGLSRPE